MSIQTEAPRKLDAARTLRRLLPAYGLAVEDFEFEAHDSGFPELFGVPGGILSVRRRSTGEERLYATSAESAWIGAFMLDLGSGLFGPFTKVAG